MINYPPTLPYNDYGVTLLKAIFMPKRRIETAKK